MGSDVEFWCIRSPFSGTPQFPLSLDTLAAGDRLPPSHEATANRQDRGPAPLVSEAPVVKIVQ